MDPLKKIQVEGYAMFAEPELLFGNLDELCCVRSSANHLRHTLRRGRSIRCRLIFSSSLFQVTYSFCKEFISLLLLHAQPAGDTRTTHILTKLFQKVMTTTRLHFLLLLLINYLFFSYEKSSKAHVLSQAYHRYALNYINALNYLETLRRHMEFCEFEKVNAISSLSAQ